MKINDELVQELWEKVKKGYDTYEIRKEYEKLKNRNEYGIICVILNVMSAKKEFLMLYKGPITFEQLKYIKQKIAGEISFQTKSLQKNIQHIFKEVEYDYINYPENIGKTKTHKQLKKLLKDAEVILNEEILDLEKAKKWVKKYKKYIIMTFGRWSKEYELYMNTAFEMPIIPTSPNILLLAMRETMKKGIEKSIEIIME